MMEEELEDRAALVTATIEKLLPVMHPRGLYEASRHLVDSGGKRLRPSMLLLAAEAAGGEALALAPAAVSIELVHNFTLIHDDIMDEAPLRRGKPTVHEKYGLTAGILCGDVMNIYSYEQLAQVKTALPQILHLFNKTAIEVCEGQQWDMDLF